MGGLNMIKRVQQNDRLARWQRDETNWNYTNDMQWMASRFCFNWQWVKQLRRLRYLQLLVQVLKAPAINLCFPVAFLSKTEKAGGHREELLTGISTVTKSTDVTRHHSIACQVNSDLIRFRCARLKIATTFRVSKVFSKSVMKAFVLIHDDARLASSASDLLLQFWLLWDFMMLCRPCHAAQSSYSHFIFHSLPETRCLRSSSNFMTTSKVITRKIPRWPRTLPIRSGHLCQTIAAGIRMAMKNMWMKMLGKCRSLCDFWTRWLGGYWLEPLSPILTPSSIDTLILAKFDGHSSRTCRRNLRSCWH